jgi:hypothetical protein
MTATIYGPEGEALFSGLVVRPTGSSTFWGIEIRSTSTGNPPDRIGVQQANGVDALWARTIRDGVPGPWRGIKAHRKLGRAVSHAFDSLDPVDQEQS